MCILCDVWVLCVCVCVCKVCIVCVMCVYCVICVCKVCNVCSRALTEANAGQAQLRQEYHQMMKRWVWHSMGISLIPLVLSFL